MLTSQVFHQNFLQPCLRQDNFPASEVSPILSVSCNDHLTPFPIGKLALYYFEDRPCSTVLDYSAYCNGWSPGQHPSCASSDPVPVDLVFLTVTASLYIIPYPELMRFCLVATYDFLARIAKPKGETTFLKQTRAAAAAISSSRFRAASQSRFTFPRPKTFNVSFWWGLSAFQCLLASLNETDGTANSKFGGHACNLVPLLDRLGKILAVRHRIFSQLI